MNDVTRAYEDLVQTAHAWIALARVNVEALEQAASNHSWYTFEEQIPEMIENLCLLSSIVRQIRLLRPAAAAGKGQTVGRST